jgi:hypothetical protein
MPFYIYNIKLCLANSAKTIKNNCLIGAIAIKCLIYLYKLYLPCYKVFNVKNIRKAKGDCKVIALKS